MAWGVLEVGVVPGDRVEGFQDIACEASFGVFGRLISHESVNEGPTGGCSCNAAKWCIEEVRVVVDRFLETSSAVAGE